MVGPILVAIGLLIVCVAFTLRTSPSKPSAVRVSVTPPRSLPGESATSPVSVGNAGEASHTAPSGPTSVASLATVTAGVSPPSGGTIDGDITTTGPSQPALVVTRTVYVPVAQTESRPAGAATDGGANAGGTAPSVPTRAIDPADRPPVAMSPFVVVVPVPGATSDGATIVQLVTAISGSAVAMLGAYSTLVWVRRGKPEADPPPLAIAADAPSGGAKPAAADAAKP
jgi:hypothetical protein